MNSHFAFDYETIKSIEKLDSKEKELFAFADKQSEQAYAPYSNFYVGAAILLDNGMIVQGSNQENASYPLCMCAERVALYNAACNFPEAKPVKMAIVANNPHKKVEKPIPPCGACRQVILEYETRFKKDIMIMLRDDAGNYYKFKNSRQLLPLAFDGSFLID